MKMSIDTAKTVLFDMLGDKVICEPTEQNKAIAVAIKTMQSYQMMQADYNARLKADMAAMLTEIQLELDEMKITKVRSAGFAPYSKDPFRRGVNCSKEIIQQKINKLKGVEDGNE